MFVWGLLKVFFGGECLKTQSPSVKFDGKDKKNDTKYEVWGRKK